MKKFLKSKGFSLLEVMASISLISIGMVGLVQMSKVQSKAQNRAQSTLGYGQVLNVLQRNIANNNGCDQTFSGVPASFVFDSGASASSGTSVVGTDTYPLRDVSGAVLGQVNDHLYPNRASDDNDIESIIISDVVIAQTTTQSLAPEDAIVYSFYLDVSMYDLNMANVPGSIPPARTIRLPIPVKVKKVASTGAYMNCVTEITNSVELTNLEACIAIGGLYENGACNLADNVAATPFMDSVAISLDYIKTQFDSFLDAGDSLFVRNSQDNTITGPLVVSTGPGGGVALVRESVNNPYDPSNPKMAVTIDDVSPGTATATLNCGPNEAGFLVGGRVQCVNLVCPLAGGVPQYLKGISVIGDPICMPLAIVAGSPCPYGGQLIINATGALEYECAACTPVASCASLISSTCSGSPVTDSCGNSCGTGTYTPPASECQTLRDSQCTTVSESGPDSCGNSCGPGTLTCGGTTTGGGLCSAGATCGSDSDCGGGTCESSPVRINQCQEIDFATCVGDRWATDGSGSVTVELDQLEESTPGNDVIVAVDQNSSYPPEVVPPSVSTGMDCCVAKYGAAACTGSRRITGGGDMGNALCDTGVATQDTGTYFRYLGSIRPRVCVCGGTTTGGSSCVTGSNCTGSGTDATCGAQGGGSSCRSYGGLCACENEVTEDPGGTGCFIAGTLITTDKDKKVSIEDIKVGDMVLTRNGDKAKVLATMIKDYSGKIYSVNGGGYFFTPNHPFLTTTGWKSLDPIVSSKESGIEVTMLELGDVLVREDGLEIISNLDSIETSQPVYNIEVDIYHEYIADGYAVHNKIGCPAPNGGICGGIYPTAEICSAHHNGGDTTKCVAPGPGPGCFCAP